jgi:LmbE family N-acetylglucosaminyl deacetylase
MTAGPDRLPSFRSVLAVCAHPDDESFGLGGIIGGFRGQGTDVDLLCFTRGEASTLGDTGDADELARRRTAELAEAGGALGIRRIRQLAHPDGGLAGVDLDPLVAEVERSITDAGAECLLVFDCDGITGHPDHRRATEAALVAADDVRVPVLAWTVEATVAATLNDELGTAFCGRPAGEIDLLVAVDREAQWTAVRHHDSQATGNPVLRRRLALQGDRDALVWLRRPAR